MVIGGTIRPLTLSVGGGEDGLLPICKDKFAKVTRTVTDLRTRRRTKALCQEMRKIIIIITCLHKMALKCDKWTHLDKDRTIPDPCIPNGIPVSCLSMDMHVIEWRTKEVNSNYIICSIWITANIQIRFYLNRAILFSSSPTWHIIK